MLRRLLLCLVDLLVLLVRVLRGEEGGLRGGRTVTLRRDCEGYLFLEALLTYLSV